MRIIGLSIIFLFISSQAHAIRIDNAYMVGNAGIGTITPIDHLEVAVPSGGVTVSSINGNSPNTGIDNNTTLLLHLDGNINDSSPNHQSTAQVGDPITYTSSFTGFGQAAVMDNTNYITTSSPTVYGTGAPGNGLNMVIDFLFYVINFSTSDNLFVFDDGGGNQLSLT